VVQWNPANWRCAIESKGRELGKVLKKQRGKMLQIAAHHGADDVRTFEEFE
jgi:hypothetical protein